MLRMLYVIYAVIVTVVVTSCNYGMGTGSSYRSWGSTNYGSGGYSGGFGGGGHK